MAILTYQQERSLRAKENERMVEKALNLGLPPPPAAAAASSPSSSSQAEEAAEDPADGGSDEEISTSGKEAAEDPADGEYEDEDEGSAEEDGEDKDESSAEHYGKDEGSAEEDGEDKDESSAEQYGEDEGSSEEDIPKVKRQRIKKDMSDRVRPSDEAKAFAIGKAEEIAAGLGDEEHPRFVKPMTYSMTARNYFLPIPAKFCEHLPKSESTTIILEDKKGEKFNTKYLARKGLSGGWRDFSLQHGLVEGDAVVFHWIKDNKTFKVYIVRCSSYEKN